jgi:hypothetical protein
LVTRKSTVTSKEQRPRVEMADQPKVETEGVALYEKDSQSFVEMDGSALYELQLSQEAPEGMDAGLSETNLGTILELCEMNNIGPTALPERDVKAQLSSRPPPGSI